MSVRSRRVALAVVVLTIVTAGTAAAAAPGDPFKLGVLNTINALTRLEGSVTSAMLRITNTTGPALDLRAPAGKAPLLVNSTTRVINLNADRLDGVDSPQLQRRVTGSCPAGQSIRVIGATGTVNCEVDNGKDLARTVIVSPVGTAVQNGNALRTALAGITTASPTNPYLLKIEPGIYDLGTQSLVMKSFVDIEGSGQGATTVTAADSGGTGTVRLASDVRLGSLTVVSTGSSSGNAYAVYAPAEFDIQIEDVEARASGGSAFNAGLALVAGASSVEVRDSRLAGSTGTTAVGLYASDSDVTVADTHASALSGGSRIGLWLIRGNAIVRDSVVDSAGVGIQLDSNEMTPYTLTMQSSHVTGTDYRIIVGAGAENYRVRIGATGFSGGDALGVPAGSCVQSWEETLTGAQDVLGACN